MKDMPETKPQGRRLTPEAKKVIQKMAAADITELMDSGQMAGDNQNQNQNNQTEPVLSNPEVINAFKTLPEGKLKEVLLKHGVIPK